MGKSRWSTSSSTRTTRRGGRSSRVPQCPTARRRLYFPVIDLLKRYSHIDDHDDTRTIRAKLTGQVLTLDAASRT